MIVVLVFLVAVAAWFLITSVATWIFQWGLTEITGMDMPFWPIFWMLAVIFALVGGTAAKS
jgi:hypothetical protein